MASPLALALALAAPQPAVSLDGLIAFSDPARCEPAPQFRQLLTQLWSNAIDAHRMQRWERAAAILEPYGKLFNGPPGLLIGNNERTIVHVGTNGRWHGVRLFGFSLTAMPGDTGTTLSLNFQGSAPKVRNLLSRQGFRFDTDKGSAISLQPNGGDMTQLICAPHG